MSGFRRAFAVAFSAVILFLALVFAFELINRKIAESGFSSGEVFAFDVNEGAFSGEVLGRKIYFDFSFLTKILSFGKNLLFLLPPFMRLAAMFLLSL